ncbi:MAG: biotin--[Lachnospiraceae bacterium]|nr:biotin--[acetyl-CoA-carboxylase] ligase [Lachnospiraceae bacterium]
MKRKILTILRNAEGSVSGQELCGKLGVTRAAVWKVIESLRADGYEIEAVPRVGYKLAASPDVLTEAEVGSRRYDRYKDAPLFCYSVTDSTNTRALAKAEEKAPEGSLFAADVQEGGKGRRGRSWSSPAGESLSMSFILRPEISPQTASMITLIAAMAGRNAVERLTGTKPMIKWPNDIILNGKKICGILTEMKLEEGEIAHIVVGMGFNVSQPSFEGELADKAASLLMETGVRHSRAQLACDVMAEFFPLYEQFLQDGDLSGLVKAYNDHLVGIGSEVVIIRPDGMQTAVSHGISSTGALLVEAGGEQQEIIAGEVSVRGVNGYV